MWPDRLLECYMDVGMEAKDELELWIRSGSKKIWTPHRLPASARRGASRLSQRQSISSLQPIGWLVFSHLRMIVAPNFSQCLLRDSLRPEIPHRHPCYYCLRC